MGEIQAKLASIGATAVSVDYEEGSPSALMFLLPFKWSHFSFRLPANWRGVYNKLIQDPNVPRTLRTYSQAQRVSWRILQDWILSQIALIEAEMAQPSQIFLPYIVSDSGRTLFQMFEEDTQHLLGEG